MPPKGGAKAGKAQDKAKQAAKAKQVEDKTFGLKNKSKSSKVQKYVQQVQAQVQGNQQRGQEPSRKDKKKQEEEAAKELAALFAMAIKQPKVPVGVDPKSIVCEYFRAGQCTKGFKCKFSHDLAVERKGGKADLFTDKRAPGEEEQDEGMEDWDQETLEKAIAQKHALENKNRPTEIVCRYFLDAVEKRQYGWFWQCPNGKECKYRHALPPGYVLKSQMKQLLQEEAANAKSVEEEIEEERAKVEAKTPINEEVFAKWKAGKVAVKRKAIAEKLDERRKKGILTGREIFAQEGFVANDDAGASADIERETNEEEEAIQQMYKDAAAAQEAARAAAANAPVEEEPAAANDGAGPSTDALAGLTEQEADEIFDDDDDDDELLDSLVENLEEAVKI